MAWISVHEQVMGGKLHRFAKRAGCSKKEALGILVGMWLWGINNADAVGRLEGVQGIAITRFTTADVVRHPIVGRIVEAYEGKDA